MGSEVIYQDLGGWWVGGCGWGHVPDFLTPSVIPFWNRLTKCNSFLQKKDFFFNIGRIFFSDLLCRVRKVNCSWEGPFCMVWPNSKSKSCLYMSEGSVYGRVAPSVKICPLSYSANISPINLSFSHISR